MPAILSDNPKKISLFIKNGQVYEAGSIQAFEGNLGHNLGGTGSPDGVPEAVGTQEETETK
jgi:hypothetical protein